MAERTVWAAPPFLNWTAEALPPGRVRLQGTAGGLAGPSDGGGLAPEPGEFRASVTVRESSGSLFHSVRYRRSAVPLSSQSTSWPASLSPGRSVDAGLAARSVRAGSRESRTVQTSAVSVVRTRSTRGAPVLTRLRSRAWKPHSSSSIPSAENAAPNGVAEAGRRPSVDSASRRWTLPVCASRSRIRQPGQVGTSTSGPPSAAASASSRPSRDSDATCSAVRTVPTTFMRQILTARPRLRQSRARREFEVRGRWRRGAWVRDQDGPQGSRPAAASSWTAARSADGPPAPSALRFGFLPPMM